MKEILDHLFDYGTLTKEDAKQVLIHLASGKYNHSQMAAFMTVYLMRNITVDELEGFRQAMLELCVPLDFKDHEVIDLCGTGGDGKNTFNISTLASFVTAGAGVKVAKHGNYGISSIAGSSNMLEYFGYKFTNNQDILNKKLDTAGICFLHAPLFHPAMKNVAPIRKELGVKTFFNILGPMVNPAKPSAQLIGVFGLELARLYNYLYQKLNKSYAIVHTLDGYDEVSLTSPFKVITSEQEGIFSPTEIGMHQIVAEDLFGGNSVKEAAVIFENILRGKGIRAQNEVVIINAALAIRCACPKFSLEEAIEKAKKSLLCLHALEAFKAIVAD